MNARERAVEGMARALQSDEWQDDVPWEHEPSQDYWRGQARVALTALLSESVSDCETCGNTGTVDSAGQEGLAVCPACHGTRKVTRPALVVLREDMEQRAWLNAEGDVVERCHRAGCRNCAELVPLYRLKEPS